MPIWNPWHGCHRISAGCLNCYVYRRDESVGRDASIVEKTSDFDLPIQKDRNGVHKLQGAQGEVYTCMTSDFFLEDADSWRMDCWKMIRKRSDLTFVIITKRIHRFLDCIPDDWGTGYPNVVIGCTCENQDRVDYRLPIFISAPIRRRFVIMEPMLGPMNITQYLTGGVIEKVVCGGESGNKARLCSYSWVLNVREQCCQQKVAFRFKQTGARFEKDHKMYSIERKYQQPQAAKAGIDYSPAETNEDAFGEDWLRIPIFDRIQKSSFRSRFHLRKEDRAYIQQKGLDVIRRHARDFVRERLAPADIPNDGKQTPMRGHPAFLAQHACACCCRDCLYKWHGIQKGIPLSEEEQKCVVDLLMEWIKRQLSNEFEQIKIDYNLEVNDEKL